MKTDFSALSPLEGATTSGSIIHKVTLPRAQREQIFVSLHWHDSVHFCLDIFLARYALRLPCFTL